MNRNKKDGKSGILLIVILIVAAIFVVPLAMDYFDTTSQEGETVTIDIPQGASIRAIAKQLKENGLIKNEMLFALKAKQTDTSGELKYGTFSLHKGMCMPDILRALSDQGAKKETFSFVVPEGFSVENIAEKLAEQEGYDQAAVLRALDESYEYDFINQIPKVEYKYKLQGFLFPNTYEFYKGTAPHDIIDTMLGEFDRQYKKLQGASGSNVYEIVTVASLVEREARLEEERPAIAGVIYNRLKVPMKLQIDATTIYAISNGKYDVSKVLYKDLNTKSPYNTYYVDGLPVGPICNPGASALQSALKPQASTYLYYHTDERKKDGSHIFTETMGEHSATMN